jgi:hypothetical protein
VGNHIGGVAPGDLVTAELICRLAVCHGCRLQRQVTGGATGDDSDEDNDESESESEGEGEGEGEDDIGAR